MFLVVQGTLCCQQRLPSPTQGQRPIAMLFPSHAFGRDNIALPAVIRFVSFTCEEAWGQHDLQGFKLALSPQIILPMALRVLLVGHHQVRVCV